MTIKDKYMGKFRAGHYWMEINNEFWVLTKFDNNKPKEFLDNSGNLTSNISDAKRYSGENFAQIIRRTKHLEEFTPLYVRATYRY